jgi:hypothetical protein
MRGLEDLEAIVWNMIQNVCIAAILGLVILASGCVDVPVLLFILVVVGLLAWGVSLITEWEELQTQEVKAKR